MRSLGATIVLGIAGLTLAGLAVTAVTDDRTLAFTLGVRPTQVAAVLTPGSQACQVPVVVAARPGSVEFSVATAGVTAPPLEVTVRDTASGRRLSRARVPGGYRYDSTVAAAVENLRKESVVAVCVRNMGQTRLALNGGPAQAARTSELELDGNSTGTDMALVFKRPESTSMASLLPDALERASLFRASWVSVGLLTGLGVVFILGVPALLALAVAKATRNGDALQPRKPV